MSTDTGIADSRVLVVEDDYLIALDTEDMLRAAGFDDIVVEASVGRAMAALDDAMPAFALLDFNLKNETSAELARRLRQASVPFAFVTGKDRCTFPDDLSGEPTLTKPLALDTLRTWIGQTVGGSAA